MASFSIPADITDKVIKPLSQQSDHVEAEEYIKKISDRLDKHLSNVVTPELNKLSVCYATYKRAFYEFKTNNDIFHRKYIAYEKELKDLTKDLIRKSIEGVQ
jgi:hypothetical protein